jgi:hypothetical protein
MFANYTLSYNLREIGAVYLNHFTPWNFSYLQKESTKDDIELNPNELLTLAYNYHSPMAKYYLA